MELQHQLHSLLQQRQLVTDAEEENESLKWQLSLAKDQQSQTQSRLDIAQEQLMQTQKHLKLQSQQSQRQMQEF
jgi:hypothetical protein